MGALLQNGKCGGGGGGGGARQVLPLTVLSCLEGMGWGANSFSPVISPFCCPHLPVISDHSLRPLIVWSMYI